VAAATETSTAGVDAFFSQEFAAHPERVIARLRAEDPVHFVEPIGAWIITRYDDVRRLFTDPNVTNDRRAYEHHVEPPSGSRLRWISENGLFSLPPAEHDRVRRQVSFGFTPRAVARMEAQIREVVERFAVPLRGRRGVVDLYAEFTEPIPNTVISRITGIPAIENDEARFRELARTVLSGINPLLGPEERARCEAAMLELTAWIGELAEERRRRPQEDLISDLATSPEAADPMTNDQIVLLVAALVAAGTDTTTVGSTMGLRALFHHPEAMKQLREDRSLLPNAVNELLRYDFGTGGLPRYALRDFELRGKRIRKGQLLLLDFMGAHRDPEVFPDPDRLDLRRDTKDLTIFGHGPHYCLGANLARAELRCMYEAVLDFLPEGARLLEDRIRWMRFGMFGRIEALPVDFDPSGFGMDCGPSATR
jgi:cytochrome P450